MLVPTYRTTKCHNLESHNLIETDPYSCLNMIHSTCVWKCVRILRLASKTAFCFPVTKNVRDKSFDDDISICAPVSLMICKQVRTDSPSPNLSLWSNLRSSKGTLKTCNTRVQFQICWSLMQWCIHFWTFKVKSCRNSDFHPADAHLRWPKIIIAARLGIDVSICWHIPWKQQTSGLKVWNPHKMGFQFPFQRQEVQPFIFLLHYHKVKVNEKYPPALGFEVWHMSIKPCVLLWYRNFWLSGFHHKGQQR